MQHFTGSFTYLSKVCAKWVPCLLSEQHKEKRVNAALQFVENEGDCLFYQIVTTDKTWIHHWTPESKKQSMVWKDKNKPMSKKTKVVKSAGKAMAMVFCDSEGVLLSNYLPCGTTITAAYYCEVLRNFRRAIQNKKRGKLRKTVFLFTTMFMRLKPFLSSLDGIFLVIHFTLLTLHWTTFTFFCSWSNISEEDASQTRMNCNKKWKDG